jgi:NhaP-type Na+/H+ or K+/H+ antiporter
MKALWSRLGGQLGVGFVLAGLLLVFLGWNGAASRDRVPAQFPYLISGGIAGLCLVVVGVGMIVVQAHRADRAKLQASLAELAAALERAGSAGPAPAAGAAAADGMVVAGGAAYHRADCRLLAGRDHLELVPAEQAAAAGLSPCRICKP